MPEQEHITTAVELRQRFGDPATARAAGDAAQLALGAAQQHSDSAWRMFRSPDGMNASQQRTYQAHTDEADRLGELEHEYRRADAAARAARLASSAAANGQTGSDNELPGDLRSGAGGPTARGQARGQALRTVDGLTGMPDAARQRLTGALERDADPDSRMARFVSTTGAPAYRSAFAKWLRSPQTGHYEWTPAEREAYQAVQRMSRALVIGTGPGGGFLVPVDLDPQILISSAGSVDPMRDVARVETVAQNVAQFVTSAGVTASWDAEASEVSDDTPVLGQPSITNFMGRAFLPVSFEAYEDTDISQQVGPLLADSKAQLESTAFTTGTGTGQPKGLITAVSAVAGSVVATGTNVLATTDLYNNQAALPARWRPRARFMMNLSILNGYRQLPQAAGLNYSIVNDDGPIPKALGWEIRENSAMDGTLGVGTDYTVLSGDFKQYIIVDRVGTTIEYVPNLFGASGRPTGQRGFLLWWRSGGDCVVPDAFRLTNHST